jgi:hypothetical protein
MNPMRKDATQEDHLRTLGIRLLPTPNAMVREHPDEFVRKVLGAMGDGGGEGEEVTPHPARAHWRKRAARSTPSPGRRLGV